jgi:hypothetical protein
VTSQEDPFKVCSRFKHHLTTISEIGRDATFGIIGIFAFKVLSSDRRDAAWSSDSSSSLTSLRFDDRVALRSTPAGIGIIDTHVLSDFDDPPCAPTAKSESSLSLIPLRFR